MQDQASATHTGREFQADMICRKRRQPGSVQNTVVIASHNQWMAYSSAVPSPRPNVFIPIHLVLARRLMVTHFDMDLNPTVPISHLKEELSTQLGTGASQQQWFHFNKLLDDWNSLERAGVIHNSIIEVRPMPGHAPSAFFPSAPAEISAEAARDQSSREV